MGSGPERPPEAKTCWGSCCFVQELQQYLLRAGLVRSGEHLQSTSYAVYVKIRSGAAASVRVACSNLPNKLETPIPFCISMCTLHAMVVLVRGYDHPTSGWCD